MRHLFAVFVTVMLIGSILTLSAAESRKAGLAPKNAVALVKYRSNVMKLMGNNLNSMNAILKGDVDYKQNLTFHATNIQNASALTPTLYPEGTGPDKAKTEAKAKIWAEWDKFLAKSDQLEGEAKKLVEATQSGDMEKIKSQFEAVQKSCGNCHDAFRMEH